MFSGKQEIREHLLSRCFKYMHFQTLIATNLT